MRRVSAHALFGALALLAAGTAAVQAWQLQQHHRLNEAIAAAGRPVAKDDVATAAPAARDAPREVRLARAGALAAGGAFEPAFKSYSGLIEAGSPDALGRQALYNLGNMYLRQALGTEVATTATATTGGEVDDAARARRSADAGPLIELAKQRYRDLLRADPLDWDARYNLERALRLAPEEQQAFAEDPNVPVERRQVMLRGMDPGELP